MLTIRNEFVNFLMVAVTLHLLAVTKCDAEQFSIQGKVLLDGQQELGLSNVDIVLYQQNNLNGTTKTDSEGKFSISTDQIGNVVLIANRLGFHSATKTITTDPNQPGVIEVEFDLKAHTSPRPGDEKISCTTPALIAGSKLECYVNARPNVKRILWTFEKASSAFGPDPAWEEVEKKTGQIADFELKQEFCKDLEHVRFRLTVDIEYDGENPVERSTTQLISRRSMLLSGVGWQND